MNKMNKFFLMGTVALSGMMGLASCASDDASDDTGKNPGTETGVVKTQFAINVPKAGGTRQTGSVVQEGTGWTFRGMKNINFYPITATNSNRLATKDDISTKVESLADMDNNGGQHFNGDKNYKIYNDVTVAVGTNNFVLYAEADGNTDDKNTYGYLKSPTFGNKFTDNTFSLQEIHSSDANYTAAQDALLKIVNDLLALQSWKDACTTGNEKYDGALKQVRDAFVKLHAGSAVAIRLTLTKIHNIVKTYDEVSGSAATEIENIIKDNFTITTTGDVDELAYKTNDANVSSFPTSFGLPEGAAVLSYSSTGDKFNYTDRLGGLTTTNINYVNINYITYPASLWYFDNTPLYATENGNFNDWPNDLSVWKDGTKFNTWQNEVKANSRVIALANPVNYANALLVTTVKLKSTDIKDAAGVGYNPDITPNAILVGGQPNQANWEFLPATTGFNKTVYDNVLPTAMKTKLTTTQSDANYTLLLDNSLFNDNGTRKAAAEQDKVNIAVEFINNGSAFQGVNGEVQTGQKFYLIAQLDPSNGVIRKEGTPDVDNTTGMSAFMRDYSTKLNLSVSSLANAYITIPDIRADKLKLGLAVDLEWENGLTFDVEFQ